MRNGLVGFRANLMVGFTFPKDLQQRSNRNSTKREPSCAA
jgi:hypothetical protein